MSIDLNKIVADKHFTYSGSADNRISGIGADSEKVLNAGIQITLSGVAESARALKQPFLKGVGGAVIGGVAGGPLGALAGGAGAFAYELFNNGDHPKGNTIPKADNFKKETKVGFPFI